MKQADSVWDAKTLDGYLDNPQKVVPGNKMPFPGLKTQNDRIDVIAYLAAPAGAAQASGRPPTPQPPASSAGAAPASQAPQNAPGAEIG